MRIAFDSLSGDQCAKLAQFASKALNSLKATQQTFLISQSILRDNIPGVFVECGVAGGAQIAAMGYAMTCANSFRPIYAIDSFEGIPLAGPNDEYQPGSDEKFVCTTENEEQRLRSSGVAVCEQAIVQTNLIDWGLDKLVDYRYVKGWFQHTLPSLETGEIAFLRLDCDLYESLACCLKHLYDRVSPGGCVFIDDYGYKGCRLAVEHCVGKPNLICDDTGAEMLKDGHGPSYWIKPHHSQPE